MKFNSTPPIHVNCRCASVDIRHSLWTRFKAWCWRNFTKDGRNLQKGLKRYLSDYTETFYVDPNSEMGRKQ